MSTKIHKIAALLLVFALCAGFAAGASSAMAAAAADCAGKPQTLLVAFGGERFPTPSVACGGTRLVPAAFFRNVTATVQWEAADQSVVVAREDHRLELFADTSVARSNETTVELPAAAVNRSGTVYVPLRWVAEMLDMRVVYVEESDSVVIEAAPPAGTLVAAAFVAGEAREADEAAAGSPVEEEELYWLQQVTEAEAGGEPYEGKVAVAASILNRVGHPNWPNSILDVIFQIVAVNGIQYYQYTPVLDRRIYEVTPSRETVTAVRDALNGADPTGGAVVFYNPKKTNNRWVRERPVAVTIGNHVFTM